MKLWMAVSDAANDSLERSLVELVKTRASILNGCANCINMHIAEALAQGEKAQRLFLLAAWHEAPCYSQRERAALAWTDALTNLSHGRFGGRERLRNQLAAGDACRMSCELGKCPLGV
jgi:AhpD family alkylhydroperoxidase